VTAPRIGGVSPARGARVAATALLVVAGAGVWLVARAPAAGADAANPIAGYSATVQALGAQVGFNIPGVVPLPDENLVEEDVLFTRTTVSDGPVVNALGAPYYPGDILANMGSLLAEFAPSGAPSVPNDPLLAMADYPPAPGHGQDASFGGTPPAGIPIAPDVFSASSHADGSGGHATATLTDLAVSAPSSAQSSLALLGPQSGAGPVTGVLGTVGPGTVGLGTGGPGAGGLVAGVVGAGQGAPGVDVGSIQTTNAVTITAGAVTSTAGSILKDIDIAGILDISQLTSSASSASDGTTGTPSATLHLAGVTADGQPAYVDQHGVHVSGTSPSPSGVTPAQAQQSLDTTLAQDGITVRLLDPVTTTNGAEASSNAGGLVVTASHAFAVPFIPGEPSIPVPGLGNTNLPAGTYNAVTTLTLGGSSTDTSATVALPFADTGGLGLPGSASPITLGIPAMTPTPGSAGSAGTTGVAGGAPGGAETLAGTPGAQASAPLAGTASRLPLGLPVPLAWVLAGVLMCVLVTYPMLLAVRWQFLGRSRR